MKMAIVNFSSEAGCEHKIIGVALYNDDEVIISMKSLLMYFLHKILVGLYIPQSSIKLLMKLFLYNQYCTGRMK